MKTLRKNAPRAVAVLTLGAMTIGSMTAMTTPAHAVSKKTWKKIAIAGAAVAGYGLLKHKGKATTIGAATAAGAYYMYKKKKH